MKLYGNDSMKHKLYLAGPFFTPEQKIVSELVESLSERAGLDFFSPRLRCFCPPGADLTQRNLTFSTNIEAIEQCDLVLACIDDFDPGTMWEIGYAYALKKPVIAYSMVPGRGLNLMLAQSCKGFINGEERLSRFLGRTGMVEWDEVIPIHTGEVI